MKPAAFLFDLDGTLIDSEGIWAEAIVAWLADRGQTATVEAVLPVVFGHSWIDVDTTLHAMFPGLPKASPMEDAKELRVYHNRLLADPTIQIIPSAVEFLKCVSKLAPCVIVSGSPHADVQAAAEMCGVAKQLKFVLGAEDDTRGKPAPDGFLKAADMLDVDASECVVVEDSTAGVAAGRAAGMHILGVNREVPGCPQDFSGCDWLVKSLAELNVNVVFGEEVGLKDKAKLKANTIKQHATQQAATILEPIIEHAKLGNTILGRIVARGQK